MQRLSSKFVYILWAAMFLFVTRAYSQQAHEETLSGPDSHETGQGPHGHLFGDWGGERTRLLERGVSFDFQYVSDSLWNLKSEQQERFSSWNRFRGTVDVDLGTLMGQHGMYFHATALWQGGGNLGTYLGLLTNPSGMASANTCRFDSWWIEKRWFDERITARAGQFAGQDFYGAQHYAASFIFEPMGYALGNLSTTAESFDPPSTPALEVRTVPFHNFYVKSMVLAAVHSPFSQNPTCLVPQFNGTPVSVSEIGFTPGKKASSVRAFDSVDGRKGYSGLYQFGAVYNPGQFTSPTGAIGHSGNYLLYWMASQALWRVDPKDAKGLDATLACFAPFAYGQPLDQRFGNVNEFHTGAGSHYAGLQTTAGKQIGGLTLKANYTFSHCIDEVSNGGLLPFSTLGIISPLPGSLRKEYGNCDYDVCHNISAFGVYEIPFHSSHTLLRQTLGGWQVSETAFLHSGLPFSVLSAPYTANNNGIFQGSGPQYANRVPGVPLYRKAPVSGVTLTGSRQWLNPDAFASVVDPSTGACAGGDSPANCQFGNSGRNNVRGPHFTYSEVYVTKRVPITEHVTFRLDTQFFNVFNHANFSLPSNQAGTPGEPATQTGFGAITSTISPPTGLLGVGLGGDSSPRMIAFQGRIEF